jgi:hypothetical protein
METTNKPVVGQVEDHFAAGRYQPCRWTGSAWVPVSTTTPRQAYAKRSSVTEPCRRCGTYCYGDCQS